MKLPLPFTRKVFLLSANSIACGLCLTTIEAQDRTSFEPATATPAIKLNGEGSDVDSIAFWEAPDPTDTLMFVTGKKNDRVEVWKFPFENNELDPIRFSTDINGVVVDQKTDTLLISGHRRVIAMPVDDPDEREEFGLGIIGSGENNMDILNHANGDSWLYVSEDHAIHIFEMGSWEHLGSFEPPVTSIETMAADDFYQTIFVPEEQGNDGRHPGVFAYDPLGAPSLRKETNRFGEDEFSSDEEGILVYSFPAHGQTDNGSGMIVVSDQRGSQTEFEFFDRQTWEHLGVFQLDGVNRTDGIASTQRSLPGYPLGIFAAIDDDWSTAIIGWDEVFRAIGWDIPPEAIAITSPEAQVDETTGTATFEIAFSEPVNKFQIDDILIHHEGTAHSGIEFEGAGTAYLVRVNGIRGKGSLTLSLRPEGTLTDATGQALSASVVSEPITSTRSHYSFWAEKQGLTDDNNQRESDPDQDGQSNLQEFATNGNPLRFSTDNCHWATEMEAEHLRFTVTFPVRNEAQFTGEGPLTATGAGLIYTVSGSSDLIEFNESLTETLSAPDEERPPLDPEWTYRTFQFGPSVDERNRGFIQLSVTAAP